MSLLKFGETHVQLQSGEFGIESNSFPVGGNCFRVFLLPRQIQSQAGEGAGVLRIALNYFVPDLGGFRVVSVLLEGEGIGGGRGLSRGSNNSRGQRECMSEKYGEKSRHSFK